MPISNSPTLTPAAAAWLFENATTRHSSFTARSGIAQLPANKKLPGVKRGGGSTLPGRLSRRCAELVGEIGEDELYALLRSDWQDNFAQVEDEASFGNLERMEAVVCTELSTWCGRNKNERSKKKNKSKTTKKKQKQKKQKKKVK